MYHIHRTCPAVVARLSPSMSTLRRCTESYFFGIVWFILAVTCRCFSDLLRQGIALSMAETFFQNHQLPHS